jgi:hypothetical protein
MPVTAGNTRPRDADEPQRAVGDILDPWQLLAQFLARLGRFHHSRSQKHQPEHDLQNP